MTGRVQDKVILVTGAASGIGLATAHALVREGARVVMTDIQVAKGEEAVHALHGRAEFLEQDVTSEDRWAEIVAGVMQRHGRLDGLVNNAGVGVQKPVEKTTLAEWRFVMAVNAEGPFLGCKYAIPAMRQGGGGSIVNVSSVAGMVGDGSLAAYCASKGAVWLMSKAVAMGCAQAKDGIRVNSVHPSFLETAMVQAMIDFSPDKDRTRRALEHAAPLGRMGQPEDAAALILFLLSDEARYCTGGEYVVDGGLTAR